MSFSTDQKIKIFVGGVYKNIHKTMANIEDGDIFDDNLISGLHVE